MNTATGTTAFLRERRVSAVQRRACAGGDGGGSSKRKRSVAPFLVQNWAPN